ncbi:hypothetical protein F5Y18DRAFT_362503 [Xylariaceae sp. FL1019]|nr:hypothetical protein F5Y18DRAFT_362503 [Xylariaceae sp. FL1019]
MQAPTLGTLFSHVTRLLAAVIHLTYLSLAVGIGQPVPPLPAYSVQLPTSLSLLGSPVSSIVRPIHFSSSVVYPLFLVFRRFIHSSPVGSRVTACAKNTSPPTHTRQDVDANAHLRLLR